MGCSCFRGTRPGHRHAAAAAAAAAAPTGEQHVNATLSGASSAAQSRLAEPSVARIADAAAGSRPSSAVPPISFSNWEAGDANDSRLSPSPPRGGLAVAGDDGRHTGRQAFAEGAAESADEANKASQRRVSERKLSCAWHVYHSVLRQLLVHDSMWPCTTRAAVMCREALLHYSTRYHAQCHF